MAEEGRNRQTAESRRFGARGEWYVVFQFVLLGIIILAPLVPWPLMAVTAGVWLRLMQVGGLILLLAGAGVANAGLLSLGWRNLTALPYPRQESELVETGAYRWVRHPTYSGIILGALGWSLLVNNILALGLTAVLIFFFDVKSRQEEVWLRQRYRAYAAYQKRVAKLIPWLY
jgi:protein-S-isoprenylcysteine O-methyltransferase Ste14